MNKLLLFALAGLAFLPQTGKCSGLTESAKLPTLLFGMAPDEAAAAKEPGGLCSYGLPCPDGATCQARAYDTPGLTRAECDSLCDTKGINRQFPSWSNGFCGWHAETPLLTVSNEPKSP